MKRKHTRIPGRMLAALLALLLVLTNLAVAEVTVSEPSQGEMSANQGKPPEPPEGGMPGDQAPVPPEGGMQGGQPPEMPEGGMPDGQAPEMQESGMQGGQPPEMPEGGMQGGQPPEKPEGGMSGGQAPEMPDRMPGGPGGSQPESYAAMQTVSEDAELTGAIESTGTDESAVLVTAGKLTLSDAALVRKSDDSSGGDAASFYGVGAALLVTGGEADVTNCVIDTDANGGAGAFAYGEGTLRISDTEIETSGNTSGGIHVAGGGTLIAENLDVLTHGESSAAIRSDRGGGTMTVDGGSYVSTGSGSPAVYVTADIDIANAQLAATGSEALCLEGRNSVRLTNCTLSGNLPDLDQNDNTWTVILYQSMSGDAEVGEGRFEMVGGALKSENGGLFYTTNTDSEFVLSGVEIEAALDCEYFLRCTGNANARGWGAAGSNGANCRFTAIDQEMRGDVIWDSASTLYFYATQGSALTGTILDDESCAGEGGAGCCEFYIDESSTWTVTGDSRLTALHCAGTVADAQGRSVSIFGTDGTVYVQGESDYTITVDSYTAEPDFSGAGTLTEDEEA